MVLAGVERSPKILWIFGERHFRQESVDYVDTLKKTDAFRHPFFYNPYGLSAAAAAVVLTATAGVSAPAAAAAEYEY